MRKDCFLLILIIFLLSFSVGFSQSLAVERFDSGPVTLHGFNGGTGWFAPWYSQNEYTGVDGYSIVDSNPMTHSEISDPGNYCQGGGDFRSTGRYFSPAAFSDYLDANGRIGVGTLYFTFLIRKEEDNDTPIEIILADSENQAWQVNEELIKIGYFGGSSEVAGVRYWSVAAFNESSIDLSGTSITIGETYRIIVEIAFGSTTVINMWVNPTDGSPDLDVPDASVSSTEDLGFWNIVLLFNAVGTGHGSFDEFAFSDDLGVVLPVEYVNFDAFAQDELIKLEWTTVTEKSNDHFRIEKSGNGKDWTSVGKVKGHGESNELKHYSFVDHSPDPGMSFYRLIQVDYDGSESISKVVRVNFETPLSDEMKVWQTDQQLNIFSAEKIEQLTILNMQGTVIRDYYPNELAISIDLDELQPSMYFMIIYGDSKVERRKLMIR